MDIIQKYLETGLATQIYTAETNLIIWQSIAKQADKFHLQKNEIQRLFFFIQQSARTNFILSTAKIFDKDDKKYPTRCIQTLLKLFSEVKEFPAIQNKSLIIKKIQLYGMPEEYKSYLNDSKLFATEFTKFCRSKIEDVYIKEKIHKIKYLRDKFIAHDEFEPNGIKVEIEAFTTLLEFATQIVDVISSAYFNTLWSINGNSRISYSAERESFFIHKIIDDLIINQTEIDN